MHKIYALWSHPRSMSTAIERVMRERGDLDCAHEPFMYDYYVHRKVRQMPFFETEKDHPVRYEDIRDMLLRRAETKPVFIKAQFTNRMRSWHVLFQIRGIGRLWITNSFRIGYLG